MDEKTMTALQGSIAKWEAIVNGTGKDNGVENCPLCKEFNERIVWEADDWTADGCFGCPVAHHAKRAGCGNTPYTAWGNYTWEVLKQQHSVREVKDERSKELAQAELDFLRSLLPIETPVT